MQEPNHTVIHSNAFGYISRCNCCKDLQLCIGNLILVFDQDEFAQFKASFFALNNIDNVRVHRIGRLERYTIMTSYSDLTLSLSKQEFVFTEDLLNVTELDSVINHELNLR